MPRPWYLAIAVATAVSGAAARASAQAPYVRIREPAAWRDAQLLIIAAGRSVLVSGVAWHPAGVRTVLVNGNAATLTPDAPLMNFEIRLYADSIARQVTVRVVPNSGEAFQTSYDVSVTHTPVAAAEPVTRTTPATTPATAQATTPATNPATTLNDPWDGFRRRSVLYMTGTALGVVLATRESGKTSQVAAGALVAGASLVIGLLDAVRTSRKAAAAPSASPTGRERSPLDVNLGLGSGDAVVMQLRWWY